MKLKDWNVGLVETHAYQEEFVITNCYKDN